MKHIPLALKMWLVITSITLCLFALLAFFLPWTLKGFFTEQIYDILLDSQRVVPGEAVVNYATAVSAKPVEAAERVQFVTSISKEALLQGKQVKPEAPATEAIPAAGLNIAPKADVEGLQAETGAEAEQQAQRSGAESDVGLHKEMRIIRTEGAPFTIALKPSYGPGVEHLVMMNGGLVSKTEPAVPVPFVKAIEQDAELQEDAVQGYSRSIDDRTMFYVIRKEQLEGQPGFMVSYAWGNYRNDLVMTMFQRLVLLMVVLIVVSWIPCLWLSRYLSRPLVLMEQQVGRIAERDWHEPFVLGRKDEMGRLAQAFELMRQRLVRQDKAQQFFLQNISHELKTPVMVIHSYAQSMLDGIYPKGTVSDSIETIKNEATRLEKRIRDLLYLNKLNYLSVRERKLQTFDITAVISDCVERLRFRRPELAWHVELPPLEIEGDPEQWGVAVENVLDNQLRYAATQLSITLADSIEGEGALDPQEGRQEAVDGKVEIRMWNDGPPIEEALQISMFDQFQTGPNGQFGLGLAIVKQIMNAHQAGIRVENEHDGPAFYIDPGPSLKR